MSHLVILPCHAIYKGAGDAKIPDHWHLAEFQKQGNDHLAWLDQIKHCISILNADNDAIVVISGGKTKKVGNISESFSYLNVVLQNIEEYVPQTQQRSYVIDRLYLEEYARDSYENVYFSLCRFKEVTGSLPAKITIVGYEFKRRRFVECHVPHCFKGPVDYVGIDPVPPYARNSEQWQKFYSELHENEWKHALKYFLKDPSGENTAVLVRKKEGRNPYRTFAHYEEL